jgi:hypothetical protein
LALNALSAHTNYLMCCKRKLETTSRCPSFKSQYSKPASHTWQLQLKNSNLICVPMLPNCKYIQGHTQGQSASGAYQRILVNTIWNDLQCWYQEMSAVGAYASA